MYDHWNWDDDVKRYVGQMTHERVNDLPAGFYRIWLDGYDNPIAEPIELKEDRFIDFADGPLPAVVTEVDSFWRGSGRYDALGVAHKRSILLHGPPGTGKSMIVVAVIRHVITAGGLAIRMDRVGPFIEAFSAVREIEPNRRIVVVIEDIDSLLEEFDEELSEVLDGSGSLGQGILYISTTNFLDRIPERFRNRPSRIDTLIEVGKPNHDQRLAYLRTLLGDEAPSELAIPELTLAELKEAAIGVYVFGRSVGEVLGRLGCEQ